MAGKREEQRADAIRRPIFFVGMPRSGTTLVFEAFAFHPELGWFSSHQDAFPGWPAYSLLTRACDRFSWARKRRRTSDERSGWLEKLRDGPAEVYGIWEHYCGQRFRSEYLLGERASEEEGGGIRHFIERVLYWQGKNRFVAKLTGPPRLGFLASIFPDLVAVHVVRDGRAVVPSLLRVPFWSQSFRLTEPAWQGGLDEVDLRDWERHGRSPHTLAAIQWRRVVRLARLEAQDVGCPFLEVRYEDFVAQPEEVLGQIAAHAGLARQGAALLDGREVRGDRNVRARELAGPAGEEVEQLIEDELRNYQYIGPLA